MSRAVESDPMMRRLIGALRLDVATYEEVEKDKSATGHAAFIVVATSAVAGAVSFALTGDGGAADGILGAIGALIGWAFYAWLAYILGTKLFQAPETRSEWGEVARTLGFASAPRFFLVFALVPGLAQIVQVIVGIWSLVATIVALQAALDCSMLRALLIAIAASFVQVIIIVALVSIV
jgi:hypothetical protein